MIAGLLPHSDKLYDARVGGMDGLMLMGEVLIMNSVGHGGSFTAEVSDTERLRTPKVELGSIPYVY